MIQEINHTQPTARKKHVCDFCGCIIEPGTKYHRHTLVEDGGVGIYDWVTHDECEDIASKLDMYRNCYDGVTQDDFCNYVHEYTHYFFEDEKGNLPDEILKMNVFERVKHIIANWNRDDIRLRRLRESLQQAEMNLNLRLIQTNSSSKEKWQQRIASLKKEIEEIEQRLKRQ